MLLPPCRLVKMVRCGLGDIIYICLSVQIFQLIETIYWNGSTDAGRRIMEAFASVPLNSGYRSDITRICIRKCGYVACAFLKDYSNSLQ